MNGLRTLRVSCLIVTMGAALVCGAALAQAPGAFTPSVGQAGKDVIWVPSPDRVVDRLLRMAEVRSSDVVVDLGSGDGKIAIAAARSYGARARGLEYNPDMVQLSKRRAVEAGVQDKVEFVQADIFASNFSDATVVTMYLLPALNLRLRPILMKMKPGTRLASHSFDMGSWMPDETSNVGSARGYLWIVPANVQGEWTLNAATGAAGAPQSLAIRQRFQKIEGDANFGEVDASLASATVRGAELRFTVRDPQGRVQQVSARVDGNRMSGTLTLPGQAPVSFTAQRVGTPQSIDESSGERALDQAS